MLIEVQIGRDISEEMLERLVTRLRQLLLCSFEQQITSRLVELRRGGEISPIRLSLDFRHLPAEVELGAGQSLVVPEGLPFSRAAWIAFVRAFVPRWLVEDVRVDGRSWKDPWETPDQPMVG